MNGITSNCLSKSSFYWKGVFKPGARIRTVLNNDFKIELKLDNFFLKSCPLFLRKKQIVEGLKSQSTKTSNWLWLIIATGFVLSTNCEYKIVYANLCGTSINMLFSVDVETRYLERGYSAFWNEFTESVLQRRTTEMP